MPFNQFIVILAAFAGLGTGYVLALLCPEEMEPGKKYFLFLEKTFRILVFVPAVYLSVTYSDWSISVLFLLGIVVSFFVKDLPLKLLLLYGLFLFMILVTAENISIYLIQASFVFLYGLVGGTLLRSQTYS